MNIIRSVLFTLLLAITNQGYPSPCDSVDHTLNSQQKTELAPVIANQLKVEEVEVMEMLRYKGWSIIYVNPYKYEPPYLFFSGDPKTTQHLYGWSGVAIRGEEEQVKTWIQDHVQGIPEEFAGCFAWHVIYERNKYISPNPETTKEFK